MEEGAVGTPEVLRSSANYKTAKTFDWSYVLTIHYVLSHVILAGMT